MNKKYALLAIACALALFAIRYLLNEPNSHSTHTASKAPLPQPSLVASSSVTLPSPPTPIQNLSDTEQNKGVTLVSEARSEQDIEVYIPPIGKPATYDSYQGDLDDYESYQAYGDEQQRKLKHAFIVAAKDKVKRLEALLQRGREEGISEEELTFAQEKIAGIKQMSERLQQELSEEN
ncbi:hypothetical protein HG263_18190 [Pseudoalteromonas sp. JBTF-M23]|uniref:Uncharacterized protein n=1 Tax=Pseudoalteromonas caenipelagi TaxID=2726988 RepID=A0A849VLI0_9GAMM|nr:hypothetical protein [Pseudoalteromonas caenipelagi]NOU52457.1 hypothetical protein [Pseudoalteromonas caenipelagi]